MIPADPGIITYWSQTTKVPKQNVIPIGFEQKFHKKGDQKLSFPEKFSNPESTHGNLGLTARPHSLD